MATKRERLAEYFNRLAAAPPAASADEAFRLAADTLNSVEDDLSGAPFNPPTWATDGRMYPPQSDNAHAVAGRPGVTRYRTKGHNLLVGPNGAIEIASPSGTVIFTKPGADGSGP